MRVYKCRLRFFGFGRDPVWRATRDKECTAQTQKLRSIIDAKASVMGSTPDGRDWCIKALHPSDPLNEVRGIPDESSVPSVFLNYQTAVTVAPPAGATGSWGFDMAFTPHPINFCHYHAYDDTVAHNALVSVLNSQLTGADHAAKYTTFKGLAQRWRLAYAGVTCVQDGASMTNQGSIAACQTAVQPLVWSAPLLATGLGAVREYDIPVGVPAFGSTRMISWQSGDQPIFSNCQSMPNAYLGLSKDGLYMPLRLSRTHQNWHSSHDEVTNLGVSTVSPFGYVAVPSAAAVQYGWPYQDLQCPTHFTGTGLIGVGQVTSALCNDIMGHICAQNLALTTRYTFVFRMGFEVQVQPATILSPHQALSPSYDPMAVEAYFKINRELKDAYPEEFNSLGKLWDFISSAARTIAPALGMIPGYGPLIAGGIGAVTGVGDKVRQYFKDKEAEKLASAADRKAVMTAVDDAVERRFRRNPPPLPPRPKRPVPGPRVTRRS